MMNNAPVDTSHSWVEFMRKGEFEKAWEFSDRVIQSGINREYLHLPRHYQCIWNGTPLNNKRVLIRCYHGLGDTLQFIRYVPLVKKLASHVIVWAQPSLLELLQTIEEIDLLIPLHEGTPEVDFDLDVEIMELPHVFRTTLSTIPLKMPYLNVEPIRISDSNTFSIGIVWKAGDWDKTRSVPFELLVPLTKMAGVEVIILQDQPQSAGWFEGIGIHPGECSLYKHARIIGGLDLLISVDSMPAHLGGALNVPVWVMLTKKADWRWMNRTDSPWYPKMKLFRQTDEGNWNSVLEEIFSELNNILLRRCF